jgi:hypothetical protein
MVCAQPTNSSQAVVILRFLWSFYRAVGYGCVYCNPPYFFTDRGFNEDKGIRLRDLASQRCQCADESEIWVKRNKICSHCQKRRVSHSSDSTSGSRRSSYESLSSSNRQLNRKEPLTNGTGVVTTI